MFEKISNRLPGYAEYYQRLVERHQLRTAWGSEAVDFVSNPNRAATALSYIYSDITQFCQEACKVFASRQRGVRYKAYVIADLFWKPFDIRFQKVIDDLEHHQALFHSEMQLEESRFVELQLRRRAEEERCTAEEISTQIKHLNETILRKEATITSHLQRLEARLDEDPDPFDPQSSTPALLGKFNLQIAHTRRCLTLFSISRETMEAG